MKSSTTIKAAILIFSLFLSSCSSLLYYPSDEFFYPPEKFNLKPEDVWFESENGDKIHAWLFRASRTPVLGTLVFFHGNAQNLTAHFAHLSWIPAEGYNYLIFEYPGFGLSPGVPTPENTVLAGRAAIRWVHKNVDPKPIVFAQSLGGAIAQRAVLDVKEEIPLRAVVLDSTFTSYQEVARKKLATSWLTWLLQPLSYVVLSDKWAAQDIEKISPVPVLVIHGQADHIVPPEMGEKIYERLKEPKEIWRLEKGLHTDMFWNHQLRYRKKLTDWLAQRP